MTDNELKTELLRVAVDIARENMFAKRTSAENRYERRMEESPYPDLPGLNLDEIILNYDALIKVVAYR